MKWLDSGCQRQFDPSGLARGRASPAQPHTDLPVWKKGDPGAGILECKSGKYSIFSRGAGKGKTDAEEGSDTEIASRHLEEGRWAFCSPAKLLIYILIFHADPAIGA